MHKSNRLFDVGDVEACKLTESDLQVLQDFFVANPDYFLSVNGMPPRMDEARQEFEDRPPPAMLFDEVFVIGFVDSAGNLIAMASVRSPIMIEMIAAANKIKIMTSLN